MPGHHYRGWKEWLKRVSGARSTSWSNMPRPATNLLFGPDSAVHLASFPGAREAEEGTVLREAKSVSVRPSVRHSVAIRHLG